MPCKPYSNQQLNFLKFASIVFDILLEALRSIFFDLWNKRIAPLPGYYIWDDSAAILNVLLNKEGPNCRIPTNISYKEWDCTALFQAILYSKTFALKDSKGNEKTLGYLYLKGRAPVSGTFHSSVISTSGDPDETMALAIDQLRLLRNYLCHSSSFAIDKATFDDLVKTAKEALTSLNLSTASLEAVGSLGESDFPIVKVEELKEKMSKDVMSTLDSFKERRAKRGMSALDDISAKLDEIYDKMNISGYLKSTVFPRPIELKLESVESGPIADPEKTQLTTPGDLCSGEALSPKGRTQGTQTTLGLTEQTTTADDTPVKLLQPPQNTFALEASKQNSSNCETVNVLLVTTDDEVFEFAFKTLKRSKVTDNAKYHGQLCLGEIGRNKVALLKTSPNESLRVDARCAKAIQDLEPNAIVSAGVCLGTKGNMQKLGDILISSQTSFYKPSSNTDVAAHDCNLALTMLFNQGFPAWYGPNPESVIPERHVGQTVSAAEYISNQAYKDEVRILYPNAAGVEKQSEGLYTTCKTSKVPWISCKSITGWTDGGKLSEWHTFGAAVSTSYVEHILKKCCIPEKLKEFEKYTPEPLLPPMVPFFTGRDSQCEKIISTLTSDTTRIVAISGSPGFGKTSVAIAVGHQLKRQGVPVYYLSLREVKSRKDLESVLLNSFPAKPGNKRPSGSTDQLCRILSAIPSQLFIILDNADYLFESGDQRTSQVTLDLLSEILLHCNNVNLLSTTRMNLDSVLRNHMSGYLSIIIDPLDADSSAKLVKEHLPKANESEYSRVAKICGHVPLAINLLCGFIKEDAKNPTQYLDEFCHSSKAIFDVLDDPDLPSDKRLKKLFDSSFERLSRIEQDSFVSLSVFVGETFDERAAVNVIGGEKAMAQKALRVLKRKCLIAATNSNANVFSFHPLIKSFSVEKAKCDKAEICRQAQTRFLRHYIQLCKDLNKEFLAGNSLTTFQKFEFDKENILYCLVQGLCNDNVCEEIFDVLAAADLFLDTMLYFDPSSVYDEVYIPAVENAKKRENVVATYQLLLGRALYIIPAKDRRQTAKELFDEAQRIEEENAFLISNDAKGKRMCYYGVFLLLSPHKEALPVAVQTLEEGVYLLKRAMLKALNFQVLAVYYGSIGNTERSSMFHELAKSECKDRKYLHAFLLTFKDDGDFRSMKSESEEPCSQPALVLTFTLLIGCLGRRYGMSNTLEILAVLVSKMEKDTEEKAKHDRSYFPMLYYICRTLLKLRRPEEAYRLLERSLEKTLGEYGDEHEQTAKILYSMAIEKSKLNDYHSALEKHKQALKIRIKVCGKVHPDVVASYHKIGLILTDMGDYQEALRSHEMALRIKLKLLGEENVDCS